MILSRVPLLLCMVSLAALADAPGSHLLRGAEHFRDGRFEQALVEFEVARALGDPGEASWYAAATLTRLSRHTEALERFGEAREKAASGQDPLMDFYWAVSCQEEALLVCARAHYRAVEAQMGARLGKEAARLGAEVDKVLNAGVPPLAVDALLEKGRKSLEGGHLRLAHQQLDEARALSELRGDPERGRAARKLLANAGQASP
jgi:hypothetical protein